ncbi:MAG: transcriptional repressor NrdR [Deltaproteobacteria bacterium]|nr:transcriptional repressor NrdR [Deltaproteobacteria bacterium]
MFCPECHCPDTRVVDSRTSGDAIRRRRECQDCGNRFTTHERVERPILWVVKKDGRKEPFSRDKVMRGLALACQKRPVDAAALDEAVRQIEASLETRRDGEVPSSAVGEADEVAYVRFASVYREFENVDQFVDIVHPLKERR